MDEHVYTLEEITASAAIPVPANGGDPPLYELLKNLCRAKLDGKPSAISLYDKLIADTHTGLQLGSALQKWQNGTSFLASCFYWEKYDEDSTPLLTIFQILLLAIGGKEHIMMRADGPHGTPVLSHAAATCKAKKVLQFFLKNCPDAIKQKDNWGKTPLHSACSNKNLDAMEILAAAYPGALFTRNLDGETPLVQYREKGGQMNDEQEKKFVDNSFKEYFCMYCPKDTANFGKLLDEVEYNGSVNPLSIICLEAMRLKRSWEDVMSFLEALDSNSVYREDVFYHIIKYDPLSKKAVWDLLLEQDQSRLSMCNMVRDKLKEQFMESVAVSKVGTLIPSNQEVRSVIIKLCQKGNMPKTFFSALKEDKDGNLRVHYWVNEENMAEILKSLVEYDLEILNVKDENGKLAIDNALPDNKRAMHKALFLFGSYDVDKKRPLHFSATAVVLSATEHVIDDQDSKPRRALKAMKDVNQVLAELEGREDLESEFVVAIVGVHVSNEVDAEERNKIIHAAQKINISVDDKSDFESLPKYLAKSEFSNDIRNDRYRGYKYLVVMELADRSLGETLMHERIASNEWPLVRKIGGDLARALDALHVKGRIHGDFKPLNIVRITPDEHDFLTLFSWQLIDLDVSCLVGGPFGEKVPSSGYCPPEMAKVLIDSTNDHGKVDTKKLAVYEASVAYDLWSFGVVLFHLGAAISLWHTNQDDSIQSEQELQKLANWNREILKLRLDPLCDESNKDMLALRDLVAKLLEPEPKKRLANFDGEKSQMKMVLQHPFLAAKGLEDENLESLGKQMKESHELLQTIDTKIDNVISTLDAQFQMLSHLLDGSEHIAPKLICFFPVDAINPHKKSWWHEMLLYKPEDFFNRSVLVFFVDPFSFDVAPTNDTKGFKVKFPRDWVVKVKPWLELGLTTLKVASLGGRLAGFPVPDIAGLVDSWLDDQLGALNSLKEDYIKVIASQTKDEELATEELEKLSAFAASTTKSVTDNMTLEEGPRLESNLKEPIKKSLEELNKLLPSDWRKSCGLVMKTSKQGETEWVLEKYATEFEQHGAHFIKKKYGVKPDDSERTRRKKIAVTNAQKELKLIQDGKKEDEIKKFKAAFKTLDNSSMIPQLSKEKVQTALCSCNNSCNCTIM